ncbi:SDR family oxidoreductase [Pseudopelagicola sp. nBUS_19]|uniref:SDR family oxidoreductase n=1 Tax=unclassified Pseudopelagicola TaxID=2649563 RepID=UPI003EBC088E
MRLANKNAIVTGGAQGFGAGIVDKFLAEGAKVLIADINGDAADQKASFHERSIGCAVDVSDSTSVKHMTETALSVLGRIDILVNNAGITHRPAPLDTVKEEDFDRIIAVNCKSIYLTAQSIVPIFKRQSSGVILNVSSTAGLSPRPNLNWYNASKGWVNTATKTMAIELAPDGIRINALNPVAGETPLLKSFMGEDTPEMRAKFLSTIPIGRFSQPEDIGNAACFLCSDEASMITGVLMEVDGGRCI